MKALPNNILVALVTGVYVQLAVSLCEFFVKRKMLPKDVSRKIVHMAAGSWILFWPYFDKSHWTWRLNVLVPAVYAAKLVVVGLLIRDPTHKDVVAMTRRGDPAELLRGPLLFALLMVAAGLYEMNSPVGIMCMSIAGFGDGAAPIIGKYLGKRSQVQYKNIFGCTKSLPGSAGFLLFSFLGCYGYYCLGQLTSFDTSRVMICCILGCIVEGLSPPEIDNLLVPLAVYLYQKKVSLSIM